MVVIGIDPVVAAEEGLAEDDADVQPVVAVAAIGGVVTARAEDPPVLVAVALPVVAVVVAPAAVPVVAAVAVAVPAAPVVAVAVPAPAVIAVAVPAAVVALLAAQRLLLVAALILGGLPGEGAADGLLGAAPRGLALRGEAARIVLLAVAAPVSAIPALGALGADLLLLLRLDLLLLDLLPLE